MEQRVFNVPTGSVVTLSATQSYWILKRQRPNSENEWASNRYGRVNAKKLRLLGPVRLSSLQ